MRTSPSWLLVGFATLALACGGTPESPGNSAGGTGGDDDPSGGSGGTGGTGGKGAGGMGGKATGGTGGSGAGGTGGGSAGTGGGAGGSAGTGGSGATGGTGGAGGSGGAPDPDAGVPEVPDAAPPVSAMGPFGCTACKPLFDGKTLEGWETRDTSNWIAKDGVLASQGKVAPIWTKADLGDYRLFFKVRQVMGNHKPDVIFFGRRPGPDGGQSGALSGAQFQPPNGGSWNYGAGGTFNRPENPMWSEKKWHHCEVLVREAGSFRAACCPMEPEAPCKLVLTWRGTGRKHPFAIQMHNPGLFDEYKDIMIEENPTVDELLCLKKP